MVCENPSVTFEGYTFTFLETSSNPGQGLFCYQVTSTAPINARNLSNWVLEVCPDCENYFIDFINIEGCTFTPEQTNQSCAKRTFVPPNQVPLIGVVFNYGIARQAGNTATFCVNFDTPLEVGQVRVGFKTATDTYVSPTTICGPVCTGVKGGCS